MSEFAPAAAITLRNEGGYAYIPATGELVNHGVTLATLRSLGVLKTSGPPTQKDIDFVKAMTQDEALDIYEASYWTPLHLDQLTSQAVANKVFDLAINAGTGQASKILQRACGITADGQIGNQTIAAANAEDEGTLLMAIRKQATEFYTNLAAAKPVLAVNLPGWLARVDA